MLSGLCKVAQQTVFVFVARLTLADLSVAISMRLQKTQIQALVVSVCSLILFNGTSYHRPGKHELSSFPAFSFKEISKHQLLNRNLLNLSYHLN